MSDDDQAPAPSPDIEAVLATAAGNLMILGQLASVYLEAVLGYKAQCVEAGFAEADASRMAADYHGMLMRS